MKDYAMEIALQKVQIYIVTTAEDEQTARSQIMSDLHEIKLQQVVQTQTLADVSNKAKIV